MQKNLAWFVFQAYMWSTVIWLFEIIADRSRYKFGGKLALFTQLGTFFMTMVNGHWALEEMFWMNNKLNPARCSK